MMTDKNTLFMLEIFLTDVDYMSIYLSRSGRDVQHYVIMFVNDLRQVCGFSRSIWFPTPIKLTATI